jgi:hypothetical protein
MFKSKKILFSCIATATLGVGISACDLSDDGAEASDPSETSDIASDITAQAGCGQAKDVFVTGGEAHWTISCSQAGATIDGVVIDTDADGKCAFVKAFSDRTGLRVFSPDAKACPKGTKTHFNGLASGATSISAFLYVQ